ncbi:MAG TPA: FAD-binding protein [Candidatus Eisenbacteria bacterium]|nr:FAD-binding protein [Candidatus Eisenbacteria bacterium]
MSDSRIRALAEQVRGSVVDGAAAPEEFRSNFGHIVSATPLALIRPASADDVVATVRFARANGLHVATRGAGHSQSHLGVSDGGLLLDMRSLGRCLRLDGDARTIDVEGGAVWRDLLDATYGERLVPPVLTNNLNVTVGGTLSIAGIGVASFRHGTQGDQVEELDVVTGDGELTTCGPDREPDLYWSAVSGLGQVGVIVRARLRLRRAKSMTRTYYLLYDDTARFFADMKRAMEDGRWDHVESWTSPCPQGTKPVNGRRQVFARWFYPAHLTVEFDPASPPDDRAMLDGYRPYEMLYTDDLPTLEFLDRLAPVFDLWKRGGTWEHVHPWMETVLPWETAPAMLEALMPDLPPSILVGGHVLLWPAKGNVSRSKLFMRPPGEDLMGFGLLPAIPAKFWSEARPMLDMASRLSVAMGGKRYLSGYVDFTPDEWRAHFGPMWEPFVAAKRRYDPDGVLNPGFVPLRDGAAAKSAPASAKGRG